MTMLGSPQAAGEHRSTCRCRSCATNRVIGAMPGRRANGSGSYRSGRPSSAKGYAQAQDPVWNEYQAERGRLFRSRSDMEDALDFIGLVQPANQASSRHTPHRRAAPLPRLPRRARRLSAGHLEGTNRRCRVPPGGSLRRLIVTERSLRAVNPAFGATPGIKSGRSAANRRSAPSRYAGAPARKNPHARWRVFALKGVETTPRTQPRFSANRTRAGFLVVEQRLTCGYSRLSKSLHQISPMDAQ